MFLASLPMLLAILTGTSITAPTHLSPRQCAIEYPSYQGFIQKENPTVGANGPYFLVWKDPTSPTGTIIESLIQFSNIPSGAWGCQLELFFPKNYPQLLGMRGGASKINVYETTGPIPNGATWNTAPQTKFLFGNTPALPVNQLVAEDVKIVINSAVCQPTMSYRITIAPESGAGGVEFWQDNTYPHVGFRMVHNC
ncbi:hypothetical protein GQ44DRAFT_159714 [Phaeosphaeriaceae sp. PMI808]|nr:hypothetical protein GQ44DRAFT_159714 [Phaeosphaeriaceae sp. PMI808]